MSEMIKQLDKQRAVFYNDYMVFGDFDCDFVTFFSSDIGLNSITIDNINLGDDHFDYCDPETIRLMGWYNKSKQRKGSKKR